MNITNTAIRDVKIVHPCVVFDGGRLHPEQFKLHMLEEQVNHPVELVNERKIHSERHQLEGLHYQLPPNTQEKLVHVPNGQTFQVAVDLRKSSPDFGKWVGTVISDENGSYFWVPEGFAHGFVTLSDSADVVIGVTTPFYPESERCIRWDDPAIGINWHGIIAPVISATDLEGRLLYQADVFI